MINFFGDNLTQSFLNFFLYSRFEYILFFYLLFLLGCKTFQKIKSQRQEGKKVSWLKSSIYIFISLFGIFFIIENILFERKVAAAANQATNRSDIKAVCHGFITGSIIGVKKLGWVVLGTPVINMKQHVCFNLKEYLKNPNTSQQSSIFALHIVSHEAVHALGISDEQRTDCRAIQINHRTAKALGVEEEVAKNTALKIFRNSIALQKSRHGYFSPECAPGRALDEQFDDAIWNIEK